MRICCTMRICGQRSLEDRLTCARPDLAVRNLREPIRPSHAHCGGEHPIRGLAERRVAIARVTLETGPRGLEHAELVDPALDAHAIARGSHRREVDLVRSAYERWGVASSNGNAIQRARERSRAIGCGGDCPEEMGARTRAKSSIHSISYAEPVYTVSHSVVGRSPISPRSALLELSLEPDRYRESRRSWRITSAHLTSRTRDPYPLSRSCHGQPHDKWSIRTDGSRERVMLRRSRKSTRGRRADRNAGTRRREKR